MKTQGFKSFFKPESSISNVAKEINPAETTTSVKLPSKLSRITEIEIINEKPNQPDSAFVFPKTTFTQQNRSCQAHWFVVYKWLAYNEFNENVTCFICKKHLQELDQEKNKEDAFLRTRFRNWKKALTSFRDHEQLKCHLAALTLEVIPLYFDVIAIVNLFTESKDNRIHIFGEFTEKGLQNKNNKHFA